MAENYDSRTIGRFPPRIKSATYGDPAQAPSTPLAYMLNGNGEISPLAVKSGFIGGWGSTEFSGSITSPYTNVPIQANPVGYAYASTVSVWVARCIEIRQSAVARIRRDVIDKKTKKPVYNHPYSVAIRRARQQGQNIYSLWERSKCVFGEVFLWPLTNDFGYKSDLKWLNNIGMNVQQGAGFIFSYSYSPITGGMPLTFEPEDIAHYMLPNWFNDLRGQSPLDTILLEIGIDKDVSRYTKAYFANDARPGIMLLPEVDLDIASSQAFIDFWKANFQGPANAGKPMVMPHVIKDVKQMQDSPNKDNVEIRESMRREICARFGVPLSVAGAWDDANYQSAPEQRRSLYEETIIPECDDMDSWLTEAVLPFFDDTGDYVIKSDFTDIKALIEDESVKSNVSNQRLLAGGITRDEYRRESGKAPLPGEDVLYIPQGINIVPVSQAGQAFTQPQPGLMLPGQVPQQPIQPQAAPKVDNGALPIPKAPSVGAPTNGGSGAPPAAAKAELVVNTPASNQTGDLSVLGDSAYVCIPLPNDPQILAIQNQVRAVLGDTVEYQDPKTFHVTLVYCDSIPDRDLQRIIDKRIQFSEHNISSTSLGLFENDGKPALYIKVDSNPTLMDTQRAIYDLFTEQGYSSVLSAYSLPKDFKPHITLAYVPTGTAIPAIDVNLQTVANRIDFTRDNYQLFDTLPANSAAPIPIKAIPQPSALDELAAWKKKAMNGGAQKAAMFVCYTLPKDTESLVRSGLRLDMDKTALKTVFDNAGESLKKKSPDGLDVTTAPPILDTYWQDYDKLMEEVGQVWLDDYMEKALQHILSNLNQHVQSQQITSELNPYRDELTAVWLGTQDNPGVFTRLILAGMAAGNQAIQTDTSIKPPVKAASVGISTDWSLLNKEAYDYAKSYIYSLIGGLDATTQERVQTAISSWIANGQPLDSLKGQLTDIFHDSARAALIAQTETTRAYNEGAKERYRQVGVNRARWFNVNDNDVCPICKELPKKGVVNLEDGWELDGVIYFPPAHPGCRCYTRPVLDDLEPPAISQNPSVLTPQGEMQADVGIPGNTAESIINFIKNSPGPQAEAFIDPSLGMWEESNGTLTLNKANVKQAALAFRQESQDFSYPKDYLLQAMQEQAFGNDVYVEGKALEDLYNQTYARQARAILDSAEAGDVSLTEPQRRQLENAIQGNYLDGVYDSTLREKLGSLGISTKRKVTYGSTNAAATDAGRMQKRREFLQNAYGIENYR